MSLRALARDLGVAARLGTAALRRRLTRGPDYAAPPDVRAWRAGLEDWLRTVPASVLAGHRFVDVPADRPPWTPSGFEVRRGQAITWFAAGRVYLSRALDVWVQPSFQLWARVGPGGTVFRGTRATHTCEATRDGEVQFASYFPGEWASREGTLGHGAGDYHKVSGGMCVLLLAWQPGVDVRRWLEEAALVPGAPGPVRAEVARLREPPQTPAGWEYLWFVGPGEIYRPAVSPAGRPSICCSTHGDAGILQHEARWPLAPGTRLGWQWRIDRLPTRLREDSLLSHEYMSIAVEFDDGQDLTYYWSSALPEGTVYRCPLPSWSGRETHVVVRSGTGNLGRWLDEERDVYADYHSIIGGRATMVVRVWLIAISLFQRDEGRCEYSRIELQGPDGGRLAVL